MHTNYTTATLGAHEYTEYSPKWQQSAKLTAANLQRAQDKLDAIDARRAALFGEDDGPDYMEQIRINRQRKQEAVAVDWHYTVTVSE